MHLHPRTTGIAIAEAREALAQNGERSDRIVPLADGFNSHAYLIDSEIVVKVGRRAFSPVRAKATLSEAFDFYNLLKNFHGDSALDTCRS